MEAFIITKGRPPCKDFKIGLQKVEIIFFLRRLLKFFEFLLLLLYDVFSITLNLNCSINYFCKLNFYTIFGIYMEISFQICLWLFCVTFRRGEKSVLKKVFFWIYWLFGVSVTTECHPQYSKIEKLINVQFKWNILHDFINLCM